MAKYIKMEKNGYIEATINKFQKGAFQSMFTWYYRLTEKSKSVNR